MRMIRRKKKINLVKDFLQKDRSVSIKDREEALDYLVAFMAMIRPRLSEFENVKKEVCRNHSVCTPASFGIEQPAYCHHGATDQQQPGAHAY